MKIIQYKNKIILDHIKEAMDYLFKDNILEIWDRKLIFDCGKEARYNILELLIEYLVIDKPMGHELFTTPELGKIKLKHNKLLDYIGERCFYKHI